MTLKLQVKKLHPDARLPTRGSADAAGLDLYSIEDVIVGPGEVRVVDTGIAICLPSGHEGQVRPRSGLAAKHGIGIVNSPGTIDADYRGPVKVILINHASDATFGIRSGDRIAQLVVVPVPAVEPVEVQELDGTARGSGGFGSSGR
jgi:dUTP pyrophosphatase